MRRAIQIDVFTFFPRNGSLTGVVVVVLVGVVVIRFSKY